MIATETAKTVLLVLFGLCVLWIVVIVVKNDMQTIVRALIVTALVGLGLYYVNQTKLEKLSFTAVKQELFPVKARAYTYHKRDSFIAGRASTAYIFDDPGPPLSVAMIEGGKYMTIKDLRTVNVILEYIDLPPVEETVSELASLTGRTIDADKFRWDDYGPGVLLVERGICRDMTSAQSFTCIARITVTAR
jgi:hypothetical protein